MIMVSASDPVVGTWGSVGTGGLGLRLDNRPNINFYVYIVTYIISV